MTTTSGVLRHTLHDSRIHNWNISRTNEDLARQIIAKYYQNEDSEASGTIGGPIHMALKKASGRQHALTFCSLFSSGKILQSEIKHLNPFFKMVDNDSPTKAYHHDHLSNTHFAEKTTFKQKHFLVSQSGMTGMLVSRMLCLKQRGLVHIKSDRQLAQKLARYIHSEFSSEILIGNRYFYSLPQLICADYPSALVVGAKNKGCNELIPDDQLSSPNINDMRSLLVELYQKHMCQMDLSINLFKRGQMSLGQIRSNPDFVQLLTMFWRYINALMAVQKQIIGFGMENEAKRIFAISDLCAIAVLVPRLFSYDVTHIFDNRTQSFSRFVKTTKETYIRLANDGLTAAFLAFAAVEPNMISDITSPVFQINLMGFDLVRAANYISKRDPIFGSLCVKHDQYIPKSSDSIIYRSRERFAQEYYPIQLYLEDIRAMRNRRKELMRVNTSSYNKK